MLHLSPKLLILVSIVVLLFFSSCSLAERVSLSNPVLSDATDMNIINLHYNERPPYLVTTETGVGGLTGDPARMVFEKSQLAFQWKHTPSKRQIFILQQNSNRDCLVGWFKNEERETFAKYTLSIYQDQPQIAFARSDNVKIASTGSVEDYFSNLQLTMLVKDGYSYGSYLDQKIQELNPVRIETTGENSNMLKMVYAGHADYFLIAPEEADGLIETSGFDRQDFKYIRFLDIINGEKRYILCSLQVEDSIIEQLNKAINRYVVDPLE